MVLCGRAVVLSSRLPTCSQLRTLFWVHYFGDDNNSGTILVRFCWSDSGETNIFGKFKFKIHAIVYWYHRYDRSQSHDSARILGIVRQSYDSVSLALDTFSSLLRARETQPDSISPYRLPILMVLAPPTLMILYVMLTCLITNNVEEITWNLHGP